MSGQPLRLVDLGYELRLLLGADKIVAFIEAHDNAASSDTDRFGNIVNYFKDSVYLYSRNLLNAFVEHADTEIGKVPGRIGSTAYRNKIKAPLERYVMHLESARDQSGKVQNTLSDGRYLNEYIHDLTAEVRRCWSEWIDSTENQELNDILKAADKDAHNDCSGLKGLLK
ncbi:hypothetical protein [Mycobacterium haemophilum]|uniref:hypothetical protein n=1 Tax=Mycobacterium haemophilum TaxID=29311 RepID=UPI000A72262A|nr:hypothetical protein [Mycobacterium haemophilum]MCV7342690.1 hypothetical protein [Mycobacterium haemophilum DSM 44634]